MDIEKIFKENYEATTPSSLNTLAVNWTEHTKLISKIANHFEPRFIYNEENRLMFKLFLQYFTGSIEFEKTYLDHFGTKGNLNKGLFVIGGVGVGKTLLFKIFKSYTKTILHSNSFRFYNASEIIDNVNIDGKEYLKIFSDNFIDRGISNPYTIYIDDLGATNESVNHYGSKTNVIEELLSVRHNVYERYNKLTHVSTNLYSKDLKERYGIRIIDRIKGMYNIIEFKGESKRK